MILSKSILDIQLIKWSKKDLDRAQVVLLVSCLIVHLFEYLYNRLSVKNTYMYLGRFIQHFCMHSCNFTSKSAEISSLFKFVNIKHNGIFRRTSVSWWYLGWVSARNTQMLAAFSVFCIEEACMYDHEYFSFINILHLLT